VIDLQSILDAAVVDGAAPGLSAAVITLDGGRQSACAGVANTETGVAVTPDTLFWIASCTKAMTSVAALQLVERGAIALDAPVGYRLPVLAEARVLCGFDAAGAPLTRPATRPITLRHLLSHTSGLAYDFASADLTAYLAASGETLTGVMDPDVPLLFEPGEGWAYGTGIDWTGRLIETVSGQRLDAYMAEHILGPLKMADTAFFPGPDDSARLAAVHVRLPEGGFTPIAFALPGEHHFMMGGGGLYSTPGDYLKFLAALAGGGSPLLSPETFALMMTNQVGDRQVGALKSANPSLSLDFEPLPGIPRRWGLAGLLNAEPVADGRSAGSLAWAGLANCYFWVDPATGAAGVVMGQLFPFGDPRVLATFEAVERAVYA
jgi:CubicO group peptidase (beta-lactamase class C family)